MLDEVSKLTIESRSLDLKVVDDILKKVKELNQTAKDIEDIALQLRKRVYNDMETETFANKKEDTKNEILINQNPVQCNLCDWKFENISSLEKHIKRHHEDYQTYNCDNCGKKFVTKWRLQKHEKMHTNVKTKQCWFFRFRIMCPFDELGCKFGHDGPIIEDTTSTVSENPSYIQNPSRQTTEETLENPSFCTSTPKKADISEYFRSTKQWFKCENCISESQCVDCYVNEHIHNQHKANLQKLQTKKFSVPWPPDRLHLSL